MAVVERTVDIIGDDALCDIILTKTIPDNCPVDFYDDITTSLRSTAFQGMTRLQSVRFTKVKSVSSTAFEGCTALKTADLEMCTSIESNCFTMCGALEEVNLPLLTSAGVNAFRMNSGMENHLTRIELPELKTVQGYTFDYRSALETVIIPKVTSLSSNAFNYNTGITQLDLPSVTSVGQSAFNECSSMEVINFGKKVTTMNSSALRGLPEGTVINVPWAEDEVSGAPWGGTGVVINYGVPYSGTVPMPI